MKKTIIRIIAAIGIAALIVTPLLAFGYEREGEGEAHLLQEGDYSLASSSSNNRLLATAASAESTIYEGLLAVQDEIPLSQYNISVDDIELVYSNVINDHPDLFYVSSSLQFYYNSLNNVSRLLPSYAMEKAEIEAAKEVFNKGVEKALSKVDSSMNNLQKALTVHDYICSNACYPTLEDENGNNLDEEIYHSAYGFFKNRTVVCAGYTLAYSYLLNSLGIPCEYVASDPMVHAWNKVYIDGSWYNADLTFDDSDDSSDETTYGSVRHAYFLKSDAYFTSSENIARHFGGRTFDSCTADSTAFDNAFWNDVTSCIFTVNGDFYYIDPPSASSAYVYLKKRTPAGNETNVCTGFRAATLSYTGGFYDENDELQHYTYSDSLARLAYLDGRFYVAYLKDLAAVTLDGTKYAVCSISNYPTGLAANDKGNLIYHMYNDNNTLYELDKEEYFHNHLTGVKGVNYNVYPDINLDGVINGKDYGRILKAQSN